MGPLADGSWGTFPVSRLVASSRGLHADLSRLLAIGSSHGALFDRQNLHAATARTVLGPPGRGELNEVADASVPVINLASNSYLELGNDPRVKAAAIAAVERHGTHMGGSRLLCGTAEIHWEFERRLAAFFEASSVVTYGSGYVTNVSLISALFGPGDLIIIDRQAHRSIYDGALLSRATVRRFAHNDLDHLDLVLKRTSAVRRRLVAVDGVYSMNGHICPLPEVASLTRSHGAFLFVDDAHAIGVLGAHGRGTVEHFGLDPELIDIRMNIEQGAACSRRVRAHAAGCCSPSPIHVAWRAVFGGHDAAGRGGGDGGDGDLGKRRGSRGKAAPERLVLPGRAPEARAGHSGEPDRH